MSIEANAMIAEARDALENDLHVSVLLRGRESWLNVTRVDHYIAGDEDGALMVQCILPSGRHVLFAKADLLSVQFGDE